jgi:rsbT antagonist protein RsbS
MHREWQQKGDAMADESISVVKVRNVLLVTMPADPDDASVSALQMTVLQMMEQYEATGLVLDISAVETLDSFFARTVAETARMAALMGGRTVIAGMRPSVAITATQLGLTLGHAMTALDVDRALDTLTDAGQRGR